MSLLHFLSTCDSGSIATLQDELHIRENSHECDSDSGKRQAALSHKVFCPCCLPFRSPFHLDLHPQKIALVARKFPMRLANKSPCGRFRFVTKLLHRELAPKNASSWSSPLLLQQRCSSSSNTERIFLLL